MLALAAAAYTIPGGLSSVVHTEVIQAMLLLLGSMVLTYFCFKEVGGWSGMIEGLNAMREAGRLNNTPEEIMSLVKPADDPRLPWTGLLLGVPLLGFYFWANNQFMVQRVLSAKDLNHGRWGALFAGLLKLPVLFFMVLPGVAAIVLFTDLDVSFLNYTVEAGGTQVVCANLDDCPNMTYPVLIYKLLPTGLLGLVIAGLLAAMSSSISATLNSASTLITMDFVSKLNKNISNRGLVRTGQIATVVLVILAAVWSPMVETVASSLWEYLQLVLGYISPPIVAVFMVGLFYRRANGHGAFYSLVLGYTLSIVFILMKINDVAPGITNVHFLLQVPALFVICVLLNILISQLTPPPAKDKIEQMTWTRSIFREETRELQGTPWYQNYRILAVILLLITAVIVIWFW
jgi:SSS family solute:Na+ symporter